MTTLIQQHRGRVVDSPGDNLLAEFASVVDAVRCAVEIQRELKDQELRNCPHRRQMEFRIGINLGDVIVEGERLWTNPANLIPKFSLVVFQQSSCTERDAVIARRPKRGALSVEGETGSAISGAAQTS